MADGRDRRVGFIGLGSIGHHMAARLCRAGFEEVLVYDLRDEAVAALVAKGAIAAASPREIGQRCGLIGVCVMDDEATETVVQGPSGILSGALPGTLIAIHSTVHPDTVQRLAIAAAEKQVDLIDAQMTGGPAKAESGELRYMVGGDAQAVERCRPLLAASAAEITHCGGLGMGAVAKLCNNAAQYTAWMGFVEAFRLAKFAGLDKDVLVQVLSWLMNDNARTMMVGRDALEAQPDNEFLHQRFHATLLLAEKDLALAADVARKVGVTLPGIALAGQQLARMFALTDPGRR